MPLFLSACDLDTLRRKYLAVAEMAAALKSDI